MASTAIYEDLNDLPLGDKLIKAQEENNKLLQHIEFLKNDIGKLCKELTQMKVRESNLKKNISELFNTAMHELDRKQSMINDLQNRLDGQYFNRGKYYKRNRDEDVNVIPLKKVKTDIGNDSCPRADVNKRVESKVVIPEGSKNSNIIDSDNIKITEQKVPSEGSFDKYSHLSTVSSNDCYSSKRSSKHKIRSASNSPHREIYKKTPSHSSREAVTDKQISRGRLRSHKSRRRSNSNTNRNEEEPSLKDKNHRIRINNYYSNTELKVEVKNNERMINIVNKNQKTSENFTKNKNISKKAVDDSRNNKKISKTSNVKVSKLKDSKTVIKVKRCEKIDEIIQSANTKGTADRIEIEHNTNLKNAEISNMKTEPILLNTNLKTDAAMKHVNQSSDNETIQLRNDEKHEKINKTDSAVSEALLTAFKSENLHSVKLEVKCSLSDTQNEPLGEDNKSLKVEPSFLYTEPNSNDIVKIEPKEEEILTKDCTLKIYKSTSNIKNDSEKNDKVLEVKVFTDSKLNVNLNRRRRCVMKIVN